MKENQLQKKFSSGELLKKLKIKSCLIEYKVCDKKFSLTDWAIKRPEQKISLIKASTSIGLYYKITDNSSGNKPADAIWFQNSDVWLIIYFNEYKLMGFYDGEKIRNSRNFLELSDASFISNLKGEKQNDILR